MIGCSHGELGREVTQFAVAPSNHSALSLHEMRSDTLVTLRLGSHAKY